LLAIFNAKQRVQLAGQVFAAAALGADLGLVVAAGSVVALSGCLTATLFCFITAPPAPRAPTAEQEQREQVRATRVKLE
jgi:H+/gluconate symporter-like permease